MISSKYLISTTLLLGCFAVALPAAEETAPAAEKILDRYIEVTGGRAAHEKVKSAIVTMTMSMPAQGMKANITSYTITPKKHYVAVEIPGVGLMEEGSDGVVAWSKNAMMGPRLKEGEEKEIAFRSNAMDKEVKWREYYTSAETAGVETADGKTLYKVVMTPKVGSTETRYYDKETGLMVKMAMKQKTPMGEIPSETAFSDYKSFDGILGPTKMAVKAGPQEMQMTIDSIKFNADIPADKFQIPADVQALIDKKNGVAPKAEPKAEPKK
jgi:hypothetical protein